MKKNIMLLFIVLSLAACGKPPAQNPTIPPQASEPPTAGTSMPHSSVASEEPLPDAQIDDAPVPPPGDIVYIFLENGLLGSWENERWASAADSYWLSLGLDARQYTFGELLGQSDYRAFDQTSEIDAPISVLASSDGLSTLFLDYNDRVLLAPFASRIISEHEFYLTLPTVLPETAYSIVVENYNPNWRFSLANGFGDGYRPKLVTNGVHDPLLRPVGEQYPVDADIAAVAAQLAAEGIPGAIPYIDEIWSADIDGDGTLERIIFANSEWGDIWWLKLTAQEVLDGNSGIYSMVLFEKDGAYTTLMSRSVKYNFTDDQRAGPLDEQSLANLMLYIYDTDTTFRFRFMSLFDLNGDGLMELAVREHGYEHGFNRVLEWQDGQWAQVLHMNWGM